MLNCRSETKLLSDAQDRKLTLSEKMSLKMHLMICPACRHFAEQMQTIRKLSRAYVKGTHVPEPSDIQE